MPVELNSVWKVNQCDGIKDGLYRVLAHYPNDHLSIIFPVNESSRLSKPVAIDSKLFKKKIKTKDITPHSLPKPFYQELDEDAIPLDHQCKRDMRYAQIKELVNSQSFLKELSSSSRSRLIANHARKQNTYIQDIYRSLNLYWKFGQEPNALLPAYKNSGGPGKVRLAGDTKRGAPSEAPFWGFDQIEGKNTTEEDKKIFLKAMKRFGMNGEKVTFSRVYEQMLKEYYAEEIIAAEKDGREAAIPKYRTFIRWVKKLINKNELIKAQTNSGDFERNKRGLLGAATDHTRVPGSCFEIDATVLDVHVVSEFRRNHVLGRPTLYCVIDKESRMIVGFHVSMEYASWAAGRQALVNAFTSKKEYCEKFGINISEQDWPCNHLPQRLLCDRGEFICKNAENLAVPLIGHLSIAPPYRPDRKGTIEQRFSYLNHKLVHELMGTTKGRHYIRGDKDPRMDATMTLREVNKMLIDAVLEHNNSIFDKLSARSLLLIENSLTPTPFNYWNIHLEQHRHSLSTVNEAEIYSRLLPAETVSMTSRGIRLNDDMYYRTDHEQFANWKTIARNHGAWKLEARVNQDNSSFIYVRLDENKPLVKCQLIESCSTLSERHKADISFFMEWKKNEKKRAKPTTQSIERYQRRKDIIENAKKDANKAPPLKSKSEKIKGMKQRRKIENESSKVKSTPMKTERENFVERAEEERTKTVVSILKRNRD